MKGENFNYISETQDIVLLARYFLSNIQRITDPAFLPESRDILQVRVKTTGVIEYNFTNDDGREFIMVRCSLSETLSLDIAAHQIDVGGQRTERKKWIHCFEDVLLIMFLAAISEYDQVLEEDNTQNRLEESLNLFGTILSYHWFRWEKQEFLSHFNSGIISVQFPGTLLLLYFLTRRIYWRKKSKHPRLRTISQGAIPVILMIPILTRFV